MYIDKIHLEGRTLDEALIKYKEELERIILESNLDETSSTIKSLVSDSSGTSNLNSPLFKILLWIKSSLGKKVDLNNLNFPSIYRVNDFVGSLEDHIITLRTRLLYHKIVDFSKNPVFVVNLPFFEDHLRYNMKIVSTDGDAVIKCSVATYEGLLALSKYIGYDTNTFITSLTEQFRLLLENAGKDKDVLDVIYETGPVEILKGLKTFSGLKTDLELISETNWMDILGTSEDKALVKAAEALYLKDPNKLYQYYKDYPEKLMSHYGKLSGANRKEFVGIILKLCKKADEKLTSKEYVILPDGYWFENVSIKTKIVNGYLEITNTSQQSSNIERLIVNAVPTHGPTELEKNGWIKKKPLPGTDAFIREYVDPFLIEKPFTLHPLSFVKVSTPIGIDDDNQVKYSETEFPSIFLKYTEDQIDKKVFWDVINVLTSLAGGYGALRVITLKGAGLIAKSIAIAELSKESVELAMLSPKFRKLLSKNGLDWLVKNWTLISISTDISTLGIQGVIKLIKSSKKGGKLLQDAGYSNEAEFLEKQAQKAYDEIEDLTGVDVRNMSDVEFDEFVRNNKGLNNIRRKSKIEAEITEGVRDRKGNLNKTDDSFVNTKQKKLLKDFKKNAKGDFVVSEEKFIRTYREIVKLTGADDSVITRMVKNSSYDIILLERVLRKAKGKPEKLESLWVTLGGGGKNHEKFKRIVNNLDSFTKTKVSSSLRPKYFDNPTRYFDDINLEHVVDKHTMRHFNPNNPDYLGKTNDMFPPGTTQYDVMNYIDESLSILKKKKGRQFPIPNQPEKVTLSNGMTVMIGSRFIRKDGRSIIGMFYPIKGQNTTTFVANEMKAIVDILK